VQRPRAGVPGDAAFFAANDLLPRLTIEVGGQRFHATEPFRGPDGRVSVVAFQETSEGLFVPRTFYLSGEHGVWRAAIAMAGGLISKGPMRLHCGRDEVAPEQMMEQGLSVETQFINESAVDLGAEMQGILSRWASVRGVRAVDQGRRGESCLNRKTSPIVSRLASLDELTLPPQAGEDLLRGDAGPYRSSSGL